jgi:flagellar biosynthesis/type III secretory pathway protein FliH
MLKGYKYQSEFVLRYYNQGHEEGRNQGHEEGRNQGREDGLRAALLALAPTRLATFTGEDAAAIGALRGEHALTELVSALGQATTPAEARTSFDLVLHKPRGA